jgi:hypothetical protein
LIDTPDKEIHMPFTAHIHTHDDTRVRLVNLTTSDIRRAAIVASRLATRLNGRASHVSAPGARPTPIARLLFVTSFR